MILKPVGINRNSALVLAFMGVYASLMGFRNAALSITLVSRHYSAAVIGQNGIGQCAAMLLAAFVLPAAISRLGPKSACILALGLEAVALAMLALSDDLTAWFVGRTLLGVSTAALCAAGETLLGSLTAEESRGRVMGIYTSILGVGLSAGPALLSASTAYGISPFESIWVLVCVIAILAVILPATPTRGCPDSQSRSSLGRFLLGAPGLAILFVLVGVKDTAQSAFFPIIGIQAGLSLPSSSLLLSACMLGGVTFPALVGYLADKSDRKLLLAIVCSLYGALTFAVVTTLDQPSVRLLIAFALGGVGSSIFALGMTLVGARFSGQDQTAAYVATGSLWGIGSLAGNLLVGNAISAFGSLGYAMSAGAPILGAGAAMLVAYARNSTRQSSSRASS
jgi:MFS family permease